MSIRDDGTRLVRYDSIKDRLFPFPPQDPRILVSGGGVGFLGKVRKDKKHRKRKYCSRSGYQEQGSKMSAKREGFTVSTVPPPLIWT